MKKWLAVFSAILILSSYANENGTIRIGLFVGANAGGPERAVLRYAVSDAYSFAEVLKQLGGFNETQSTILRNPGTGDLRSTFNQVSRSAANYMRTGNRVEFLFYYSGHSDENGLLLRDGRMDYRELKAYIDGVAAIVRIGVLDSCASGAFTRLKGSARSDPFLAGSANSVEGRAFLTSSAEDEASQESDRIGASFFTFALVTGLRGGADYSGDGTVTLAEAYQYAYNETLAHTEGTRDGPQHASFLMQLTGTGDLVLTKFNETTSRLILAADLEGRVFIRDERGRLLGEFQKTSGSPVSFAAPQGDVTVSIRGRTGYSSAQADLKEGVPITLNAVDFVNASVVANRVRGDDPDEATARTGWESYLSWLPFVNLDDPAGAQLPTWIEEVGLNFGVVPGLEWKAGSNKASWVSTHLVISAVAVSTGFQSAAIGSFSSETTGMQGSGIFNINAGSFTGLQAAGIFNSTMKLAGAQTGLVNVSEKVTGVQIGLVNIASEVQGFQFGLVNISPNAVYRFGFSSSLDTFRVEGVLGTWGWRTRALLATNQLGSDSLYLRYFQADLGWEWEDLGGTPFFLEALAGRRFTLEKVGNLDLRTSLQTGVKLGGIRATAEISTMIPWDGSDVFDLEVFGGVQLRF